ncbi:MAG: hypothetical protein KQH83_11760 [Actinobacteria bacterium]|nr:hypothetical protein [Actinomycetota bacterium]
MRNRLVPVLMMLLLGATACTGEEQSSTTTAPAETATATAPTSTTPTTVPGSEMSEPESQGSSLNIVAFLTIDGEITEYGWGVGFGATVDFGPDGPRPGDVEVRVDGETLEYLDGFEVPYYDPATGEARIEMWGPYGEDRLTPPTLGEYDIWISDASGEGKVLALGALTDIPASAPEIVTGVGAVSATPEFSWLPFRSRYGGALVDPWSYEFNLGTPEEHWLYPIDPSRTTIAFDDPDWQPGSPEPLAPGVYSASLHSNHAVVTDPDGVPIINFEHHVGWEIVVGSDG